MTESSNLVHMSLTNQNTGMLETVFAV